MRAARAMATWMLGICLTATAFGQEAATTGQVPTPPASGQARSHNPGQEVAGEQAEGAAMDVGPAKLRIGGYLGVTALYRSTNSGGGPGTAFAAIPYEDTLQGNVSETRLTAQSSRISIRVDAPFPEARLAACPDISRWTSAAPRRATSR